SERKKQSASKLPRIQLGGSWGKARGFEKPGKCPRQNITCDFVEKGQCHTDFNCKHSMKCCHYSCGKKCLDPKADLCILSPEVGNCDDFHLRWFYSIEARTCEYFFYSGCNGNVNNFPSKKICEDTCDTGSHWAIPPA
uniref:BPTI/Kunitz inhibitor domain-containing protein n=1 Tax=Vombatus ursinus TaxID=29139 RepID=A0A4X2MF13_VOMUR